jgi:hypothetical protein
MSNTRPRLPTKEELKGAQELIEDSLKKDQIDIKDISAPMNYLRNLWRRYYGVEYGG